VVTAWAGDAVKPTSEPIGLPSKETVDPWDTLAMVPP